MEKYKSFQLVFLPISDPSSDETWRTKRETNYLRSEELHLSIPLARLHFLIPRKRQAAFRAGSVISFPGVRRKMQYACNKWNMQATNLRITDEAKLTAAVAKGKKYADCADPSLSLSVSLRSHSLSRSAESGCRCPVSHRPRRSRKNVSHLGT